MNFIQNIILNLKESGVYGIFVVWIAAIVLISIFGSGWLAGVGLGVLFIVGMCLLFALPNKD